MSQPPRAPRSSEPAALLDAALAAHRAGDLDRAERRYRELLDSSPEHADAACWLGLLLHQRGRHAEARDLLARATRITPEAVRAHVGLAVVEHALGDRAAARERCLRALALDGGSVPALSELASLATEDGELDEAARLYRSIAERAPALAEVHHNLGVVLQRAGRLEEAADAYGHALAIRPSYLAARANLANTLHRLERPEEALSQYRLVLELEPRHGLALHMSAALSGRSPASCPPEFVVGLFDDCAESFDERLVGQLGYATPSLLLELIEDHSPEGERRFSRVLDLGCGTGLVGRAVRPRCTHLVGVDLSPRMIEVARRTGLYDELVVADVIGYLASAKEGFDLAVAADVAPYLGDLEPCMVALARAAAPGAWVALSVEVASETELPSSHRASYVLRPSGRYAHDREHVLDAAATSGLRVVEARRRILRREGAGGVQGDLFLLRSTRST